jgi:hypothetical protein
MYACTLYCFKILQDIALHILPRLIIHNNIKHIKCDAI